MHGERKKVNQTVDRNDAQYNILQEIPSDALNYVTRSLKERREENWKGNLKDKKREMCGQPINSFRQDSQDDSDLSLLC